MFDNHPITPPPELVEKWRATPEYTDLSEKLFLVTLTTKKLQDIATKSAQWGADQELEACCDWLIEHGYDIASPEMRAARRKPPTLKEQALDSLQKIEDNNATYLDSSIVRRALEALPND